MSDEHNPTIFGAILRGEIPATRVWDDEHCIAFRDINPAAPTHVLVIPRKYMKSLSSMTVDDRFLIGHLCWVATQVAKAEGLEARGYRTVINTHEGGGQTVFHLHVHVMGGRGMAWPPG